GHREHERDREQRQRTAPRAQLLGGYAWPPNGCGSHPGWISTSAPHAISRMPAIGTARCPAPAVFSNTISAVSTAIHHSVATPAANITSIRAQQQPRQ